LTLHRGGLSIDPAFRRRTWLGVFLIAVAAIALFGYATFAVAEGEETSVSVDPGSDPAPLAIELPTKRTATSQTFELPDGSRETRLYQSPVNYRDAQGDWKPIDEGLEGHDGQALTNGENSFDLTLPARLGAAPVRFSKDGAWVASKLLGDTSEPVDLIGGDATYEMANPGTTFELSSLPNGLKEDIEIASPSAPSTFRFELSASAGVSPTITKEGAIEFRDQDDHPVAELPAPVMSDSSEKTTGFSTEVEYRLELKASGNWELTVIPSSEWLEDPDRQWPVTIDPTITLAQGYFDCTIYSATPIELWNKCAQNGQPQLSAEAWYRPSGPDEFSRSTLFWRLIGQIPSTASVQSASMRLYSPKAAVNTLGIEAQEITQAWSSYVSWKYSGYPNCLTCSPWTTPGGTVGGKAGELTTASRGTSAAGYWEMPLSQDVVQHWVTGGEPANFGVLVKQLEEQKHVCTPSCPFNRSLIFESSAAANVEQRPHLSIVYIPQAPKTSVVTSPIEGQRTARRLKLQSSWQAPGVSGISFQYREGRTGSFKTIPPELVHNAQGNTISWPLSIEGGAKSSPPLYFDADKASSVLKSRGGPVQVRAIFIGAEGVGGSAGYTEPVEAQISPLVGGPNDATTSVGPGTVNLLTGNFSTTQQDLKVATFNSALEFSHTYNSRPIRNGLETEAERLAAQEKEDRSVLGRGWTASVPVESAGSSDWTKVRSVKATETIEGISVNFEYAVVSGPGGAEIPFLWNGGSYIAPPELTGWALVSEASGNRLVLSEPQGNRTTFQSTSAGEYLPILVTQTGGSGNSTKLVYDLTVSPKRLKLIIAPSAPGVSCNEENAEVQVGCKSLKFSYLPASSWGAPASYGDRLSQVTLYAPGFSPSKSPMAKFAYDALGRLTEEYDPRSAPLLRTTYSYYTGGQLKTITPPGLQPWTLEYGATFEYGAAGKSIAEEEANGRLIAVKRASLLASPSVAQTTIVYGVPLGNSINGLSDMSRASVASWGQTDLPVDATAVFPPDQVPTSSPPSDYTHASIFYMDAEGRAVNTATPKGAGTSAPSISTSEYDEFGNIVKELTPQNRVRALEAASESAAAADQLATKRTYGEEGTQLEEEFGPLHLVKSQSGASVEARLHRRIDYDLNWEGPGPKPHLPTRETSGARLKTGEEVDQLVTETRYNWSLRLPTETIIDPGGLNIRRITTYDGESGLPIEQRQPSDPSGETAGTTVTRYYASDSGSSPACQTTDFKYLGLPCEVRPKIQPETSGQPDLPVTKYLSYDSLGDPTAVQESPGGGATNVRTTVRTYDLLGRLKTQKMEGGGVPVPKVEIRYSPTTGLPERQEFICEEASCEAFDNQATSTIYDGLGRPTRYEDADGNIASTTYDLDGRPATFANAKGTQTLTYDASSGLLTKIEDSGAGTFTAAYDADGNLIERTLPNGLRAAMIYNQADEPVHLTYTKQTNCGVSCIWFDEGIDRSIYGQDLSQAGTFANSRYTYDKAGRLTSAAETPAGGSCTTRSYTYDVNSNRKSLTSRPPVAGACNWSTGTVQAYKYDAADRLEAPAGSTITYDNWGRITSLPAVYAGGKSLTTTFFSTNMVASQTQNGVTNTFQLDGTLRQRQRVQGGGLEGVEVFHYDNPSDAPSWTERGSNWTRNIVGFGGELCGVQENGTTTLRLTNLQGDVVASASLNSSATSLSATYRFDEFGNPMSGNAGRYGWLGGAERPSELSSGVIQMGARSYVPSMGRFLSADPEAGGSSSAYDYASADPVNNLDLNGMKMKIGRSVAVYTPPHPAAAAAPAPTAGPAAGAGTATATASSTPSYVKIMEYLKDLFSVAAPIAYGTCVPESAVGPDAQLVHAAFGKSKCIPKLKFHVTNPVQLSGIKAVGWSWCIATNAWAAHPFRGQLTILAATAAFAAWCGTDERAWAYVTFY
jgi:RHS repeat-associated protein